ncbi:MAG: ABC transporter ATP-binding protein [Thermotogota bacterium]|nr:ABC transporter ATP-binding protein [Thermotogota bacterium]
MMKILEVKQLKKYFFAGKASFLGEKKWIPAVDDINFDLKNGETLGLAGESGCGKSTLGRTMLKLLEPTAGSIYFKDEDISKKSPKLMKPFRKKMQMIFQDPYASLNPRMTIGNIIAEPLIVHDIIKTKNERIKKVKKLLEDVGLQPNYYERYPSEFSGGQRQRVMIARVLATEPEIVIADEAVSALDVSIQSQILNLMCDLQDEYNLSYIFISHDLGVVKFISDRIAVMYLGKIVELAESNELYNNPLHPYTKVLLDSIPKLENKLSKKSNLTGEIPSAMDLPAGCRFEPRCEKRIKTCKMKAPELKEVSQNHFVSCHLFEE